MMPVRASTAAMMACAALAGAIAAQPATAAAKGGPGGNAAPVTRAQVIALIKRYDKHEARGARGPAGPKGPAGVAGPPGPDWGLGPGLSTPKHVLTINPSVFQSRVSTDCGAGYKLMTSISSDGTAKCNFGTLTNANQLAPASSVPISASDASPTSIVSIGIGQGVAYLAQAQTELSNTTNVPVKVSCSLDNGSTVIATGSVTLPALAQTVLPLQAWFNSNAASTALTCSSAGIGAEVPASSTIVASISATALNTSSGVVGETNAG